METGTARITFGLGEIDTAADPTPVGFDPHTFSNVTDGAAVYFTRSSSRPDWAIQVVPAMQVDSLLSLATPPNGFTGAAKALVRDTAARLCAEVQFAPSPSYAKAHFRYSKRLMAGVATGLADAPQPAGVSAVRPYLT